MPDEPAARLLFDGTDPDKIGMTEEMEINEARCQAAGFCKETYIVKWLESVKNEWRW